jgi:hypothetical protein
MTPEPDRPYSPGVHTRDAVAQGRMILIAIGAAYLTLWILEFVSSPVILVPGFLFDRSLATAQLLFNYLFQFGVFSAFVLLTLGGVRWVRYVYAAYLLLAGLISVIVSIEMDSYGGVALILGGIEIVSAGALATSISVLKYLADRREKGVPWLLLGLTALGLVGILIGIFVYDGVVTEVKIQLVQRDKAAAVDLLQKLGPGLDAHVIDNVATEKLRKDIAAPDFADQFTELKAELGAFKGLDDMPAPGVASIVMDPPSGSAYEWEAKLHYEHGDLLVWLDEDTSGPVTLFSQISWERVGPARPAQK